MARMVRYTVSYKRPTSRKLRTWSVWVPVQENHMDEALEASKITRPQAREKLDSEWQEYGISRHEEG